MSCPNTEQATLETWFLVALCGRKRGAWCSFASKSFFQRYHQCRNERFIAILENVVRNEKNDEFTSSRLKTSSERPHMSDKTRSLNANEKKVQYWGSTTFMTIYGKSRFFAKGFFLPTLCKSSTKFCTFDFKLIHQISSSFAKLRKCSRGRNNVDLLTYVDILLMSIETKVQKMTEEKSRIDSLIDIISTLYKCTLSQVQKLKSNLEEKINRAVSFHKRVPLLL